MLTFGVGIAVASQTKPLVGSRSSDEVVNDSAPMSEVGINVSLLITVRLC